MASVAAMEAYGKGVGKYSGFLHGVGVEVAAMEQDASKTSVSLSTSTNASAVPSTVSWSARGLTGASRLLCVAPAVPCTLCCGLTWYTRNLHLSQCGETFWRQHTLRMCVRRHQQSARSRHDAS